MTAYRSLEAALVAVRTAGATSYTPEGGAPVEINRAITIAEAARAAASAIALMLGIEPADILPDLDTDFVVQTTPTGWSVLTAGRYAGSASGSEQEQDQDQDQEQDQDQDQDQEQEQEQKEETKC